MKVNDNLLLYCLLMEAKRFVDHEGDRAIEAIQKITDEAMKERA